MLKEKKTEIIEQLEKKLSQSEIVISTDYQGIRAKETTAMRRALKDPSMDYQVVKNNLIRIAAQNTGKEAVMDIVDGPTAMIFGYEDVVKTTRDFTQYVKNSGLDISIKGALLGEKVLKSDEVIALANLPSREVLLAQMVAMVQAPLRSLHNVLQAPIYSFYNVLQARMRSLS